MNISTRFLFRAIQKLKCKQYRKYTNNRSNVFMLNFPKKFSTGVNTFNSDKIDFTIVGRKGEEIKVSGEIQDTILDAVIDNDVEIESFGVCEGTIACSTCHVILNKEMYDILFKKCEPTYEEFDMLDLAYGLTETSRLGCQIELCKEMKGAIVKLPSQITDARNS